jgi:2-keto-4-pentenoate hydratase
MTWPRQVDPQLVAALKQQHRRRAVLLATGASHVGWKIGDGNRERIGGQVVVGYLTSATLHPSGATVTEPMKAPRAEVEIAVTLGAAIQQTDDDQAIWAAISGFRTALEICDVARPAGDNADLIVADNVFHTGLALGASAANAPQGIASIDINGVQVESSAAQRDLVGLLRWTARLLTSVGARLSSGDVLITGGLVHVPVHVGDHVTARLEGLEEVSLDIGQQRTSRHS